MHGSPVEQVTTEGGQGARDGVAAGPTAHGADRGRSADPRGAHLQPSRQPAQRRAGRPSGRAGPPTWWIPDEAVDAADFSLVADWFGRAGAPVVEIGSGIGEATAALAADPSRPRRARLRGLATRCRRDLPRARAGRRRERAADQHRRGLVLRHLLRRRVSPSSGRSSPTRGPRSGTSGVGWSAPEFAAVAASRLAPGALWRLATDGPPYADQMELVLDGSRCSSGGRRRALGRTGRGPGSSGAACGRADRSPTSPTGGADRRRFEPAGAPGVRPCPS